MEIPMHVNLVMPLNRAVKIPISVRNDTPSDVEGDVSHDADPIGAHCSIALSSPIPSPRLLVLPMSLLLVLTLPPFWVCASSLQEAVQVQVT